MYISRKIYRGKNDAMLRSWDLKLQCNKSNGLAVNAKSVEEKLILRQNGLNFSSGILEQEKGQDLIK